MKLKKIVGVLLVGLMITNIGVVPNAASVSQKDELIVTGTEPTLLLEFQENQKLNTLNTLVEGEKVDKVEGSYILNGERITFIYNNVDNLTNTDTVERIKEKTRNVVNDLKVTKDKMFPDYKNTGDTENSVNSLHISKLKTKENADVEKLEKKYSGNSKVKTYNQFKKVTDVKGEEVEKHNKSKKVSQNTGEGNLIQKGLQTVFSVFSPSVAYAETIGGDAQSEKGNWLTQRTAHPKQGDRQDRLGLISRKTGSQYNWLPNSYAIDVFEVDASTHLRQVNIGFTFNSDRLSKLNIDSDEAFEAEVLFYNYGPNTEKKIPEKGHAYIYTLEYINHNIPTDAYPYEDTRYRDEEKNKWMGYESGWKPTWRNELTTPSFCIGVANSKAFQANTKYWCVMQGKPQTYLGDNGNWDFVPTTGLAQLNFQRGYNFVSPTLEAFVHKSNGHDTWSVFNEEYEKIVSPLPFKNNSGVFTTIPKRYELTIDDDAYYIKRN